MSENAILVENLSKRYLIGHRSAGVERYKYTALRDVIGREVRNFARKAQDLFRGRQVVQGDEVEEFWALRDINFEIKRGEVLGVIGRNGAGKSTLLKILSRITPPTEGKVSLRGRVASLLEVGTGFHPELTGRENIFLNGVILGMTRREIRQKFDAIVDFAEVEKFLDTPVKHYSSGMYVRLAFAVAAHLEAELLIVDEVLAVGDFEFQKKCLGKMNEVSRQDGRTVLLVSHNMSAIQSLSDRVLFLEGGCVKDFGEVETVIRNYAHPKDLENYKFNRDAKTNSASECDILDAWFEVGGVRSSSPIDWDEEMSIVLILNVKTRIICSPEFLFRDSTGVPALFAPTGHYDGFSVDLSPGAYQLRSTCKGLRLASGTYMIDVAVAYTGVRYFVYYESALRLEVADKAFGDTCWHYTQRSQQARVPLSLSTTMKAL